ncbi:MAG: caspase family protein [Candidatus Bipolaricaulis sp.]|nr:caspase family protein [Candidatus Bipolaricaulis sp.]
MLDFGAACARFVGVLVAVSCVWLAFSAVAASQTAGGKTWAIVIGISKYGDPSLSGRSLRYAESDAQEIRDALVERCGVPQQNIHLLKGSKATKSGIEKAFASVSKSARSGDLVFVYFSGHGSFVQDRDGDEVDGDRLDEVLLPYDAVLGDESTYILDDLLGYMVSRLPVGPVAIIVDSCHSAGQGKSVPAPGLLVKGTGDSIAKDIFTDAGAGGGRALLSACQSGEVAYERDDLGHGVLTYFVLQSLEQAAADSDHNGVLTFDELGAYVESQVAAWCLENQVFQTPSYESHSSAPIIIVPVVIVSRSLPVIPTPPDNGTAWSLGLGIMQSVVLWQTSPPMVSGVTQVRVGVSRETTEFGAFVSLPSGYYAASGGALGCDLGFEVREFGTATLYAGVSAALDLAHNWAAVSGSIRIAADLMPYLRVGAALGLELGLSSEATGWTTAGASLLLRFSAEARLPFGAGQ